MVRPKGGDYIMPLAGIQKKIADRLMKSAISHHIKTEYLKKGVIPTVSQVMQDIPVEKMLVLLRSGYSREEIEGMAEDVIRRQK